MSSKHPEPTSMTLSEVEVVSLTIDVEVLASELSRQPIETLIALIARIDYHTADWHFFDALETWMKYKLSQEMDDPMGT